MLAIALALASAIGYGSSDFLGGVSARRAPLGQVALLVQTIGFLAAAAALIFTSGVLSAAAVGWGGASGVAAGLGSLALYRGLAAGQMSVAGPLSGVGSVVIPVLAGLAIGERPSPLTLGGIILALPTVSLIARSEPAGPTAGRGGVLDGLLAGIGFGLLFVALAQAPSDAGLWPGAASMLAAGVTVGIYWWVTGGATNWHTMGPRAYPAVIGAGVLGAAGPVCYLLATRHGLLVVTAVLAGLYPGVTVGLARIVLHERSRRIQLIGLILAAIAVTAITIG